MQFLLDNIAAGIVVGVLVLVLAVVQQRGQQAAAETAVHDMVKARAQALAEMLEEEFENMGAVSDPDASTGSAEYFVCEGTFDGERTTRFRFSGVDDSDAESPGPAEIIYQLSPATDADGDSLTVRLNGTRQPLYRMQRLQDGVPSGSSGPVLTHLKVEVATDDGPFAPVDGPCPGADPSGSDVRLVRLTFMAALAPVEKLSQDQQSTSDTHTSQYGITLRPPGMKRF